MADQRKSSEAQFSAHLDGELSEIEAAALDALLEQDSQARAALDALRRADTIGREHFDELLKEPVSLDLVRSIKTASEPRRVVQLPQTGRRALRLRPTLATVIASSLLMFGLGTGAGYMFGARPSMVTYADIAGDPAKAWMDDVASHYRLFSRQSRHLVEVPANESAHIVEWLMATTGVSFRIPDLSAEGLDFLGARLYSAGGRPVGQLIYRNRDGDIIGISFAKNIAPIESDMREVIRDDIGMVAWQGLQASYVVTGPSSDAFLDTLAGKVARII
ncbi:anti-sigma factor [Rhizobium sp. SSA_523]|uniref:anti-sigma factor family protein n=1 Tax=Rhizobium sp. SSA_523 TaxID=2952477 RepID=UPI002090F254|nr:anti-sigma factor [Rhizobium sp. SSA_523]MCO5730449.1 anti-sigma factor [Rhizobium sp. SSA_523]WKC25491.1 anti-sigma factor [Rhizobium sp. SSA_523]